MYYAKTALHAASWAWTQNLKQVGQKQCFSVLYRSLWMYMQSSWEHWVKLLLSLCYGAKLVLLTAWQVSKLRDQVLGQAIETIWKASRLRRWWTTTVPENHLPRVRIKSFILKGGGVWLVVANFLVAFVCTVSVKDKSRGQTSNQTNVILCCATFYLWMNGKMLYL